MCVYLVWWYEWEISTIVSDIWTFEFQLMVIYKGGYKTFRMWSLGGCIALEVYIVGSESISTSRLISLFPGCS